MKKIFISLLIFSIAVKVFGSGHVATAIGVNPACNGFCNGSATAAASGGIGPYGFSWTGPSGYTGVGENISGLCAGVYVVTATDSSDMSTAVYTLNLTDPPLLAATITGGGPICAGASITLNASVTGGTPGYTYSWTPATDLSSTNTVNPVASPASTTTYVVTVTDANGCTATANTIVIVNPVPTVTASSTSICAGQTAFLTASGAVTYSWSFGGTTNPYAVSPATTTSYTVTGSVAGCSGTAVATVTVLPLPVVSLTPTPSSCGGCTGMITTSGTGISVYSWSGPSGYSATIMNPANLCVGTYTLTASDFSGCTTNASTTITNSSSMTATIGSVTPSSCNACDGGATVAVTGGTAPYAYNWIPGGNTTQTVTGLCAGSYSVTVTDASGCSTVVTMIVPSANPIVVTGTSSPSTCGACDGTVTIAESGGTAPYLYDLGIGASPQTNGSFSGVCPGVYITTVTDVNGCSGIYTVLVSSTSAATFTVSQNVQNESASGLNDGFIDLTVTGTTAPYTFSWSNGATTEDLYSLAAGTYTVIITDNTGDCATYTYMITTTPSYGFVTGYVYSDNNTNCAFDSGDAPLAGYYVSASDGTNMYWGYTNGSGFYSIWVPAGSIVVTPTNSVNLEAACTSSYTQTLTGGTTSANNDFAYTIPPFYDVCIYTYSNGIVPGFDGNYNVYINNYGNQPATGVAYLVLPGLVNYISSSPAASSVSGDTVFWNYTNLLPYSTQLYTVIFNTPASAVLGTTTIAYANATVTNGTDINPGCNYYTYTRTVTGSFDPNEKTVSPAGENASGDIALTEEEFTYLIRFQNTGSGPAVNIYVTDTLSSLLDPLSFKMLDASHPYIVELMPGNVIRWQFDSIMLVDSTTNEALSHGHVQFRISKLNTPAAGQVIENTANIYFDFNAPVITNTAVNTYVIETAIDEMASDNGNVNVYPNPFSDNTTFVIQSDKLNETYSFEMTDLLGKTVKTISGITEKQFSISRNGLQNGIYFYKIRSAGNITGIGKMVIK